MKKPVLAFANAAPLTNHVGVLPFATKVATVEGKSNALPAASDLFEDYLFCKRSLVAEVLTSTRWMARGRPLHSLEAQK